MFNRKIIQYLDQWKKHPQRKPLIIRGARQVGKTSAIKLFAHQSYSQLVYLNYLGQKNYFILISA